MSSELNHNDLIEQAIKLVSAPNVPYNLSMDLNGLRTHANAFIKDAGVQPSPTQKVSARLIYWRYLKWCTYKKVRPISKNRLLDGWNKYFKKYVKKTKHTTEIGYYIEDKYFNISKEEMEILCQYEKRIKAAKERKVKRISKKIQNKQKKKQEEIETLIQVLKSDSSQE